MTVAQALYQPDTPPDQLAMFGLFGADLDDTVEVLPDIWPAFRLLSAMATQWRVGMGGPVGLDYGVIRDVGEMLGMKRKQITAIFPDLQVMEAEALGVMREAQQNSP